MNYFANRLMRDERSNPIVSCTESDNFPLCVCEHQDGTFSIEWSEIDDRTRVLSDWSQEDFARCILQGLEDTATIHMSLSEDVPEVKS